MKKNTAYTIGSLIVLLICAFCFVVLPAFTGSEGQQNKLPPFGKYNKREIAYEQDSDFYNYVSQYGQMFQAYGQQLNEQTYYTVFKYAFDATVRKYAYEDAVNKSGYVVPQAAVNRNMVPFFSDENGNYSSKLYKQTDAKTVENLRKSIQSALVASRYSDDLFGSEEDIVGSEALYGLKESDAELEFLKSYNANKRGFQMALFNTSDYPEEEKLKFAKENQAKFNKYDISIVTVEDKAKAQTVLKRINNNEITFEDAISEYSLNYFTNSEGKVTSAYQYQIENLLVNKDDLAILTDLAVDSVTDVIETSNSFSIFKKNGETKTPDFEIDEYKDLVSTYLRNYEKTRIEDYFTAKANDFIAQAAKSDFDSACTSMNIKNVEIPAFPLNYGSVDIADSLNTSIEGLSSADTNEKFLETAFNLKMNEMSEPMVLNGYVAVIKYTSDGKEAEAADTNDEETDNSEDDNTADVLSNISDLDQSSANSYILSSDKLENNFAQVYFSNMMNY